MSALKHTPRLLLLSAGLLCLTSSLTNAEGLADPTLGLKLELGYETSPIDSGYLRGEASYLVTQSWLAHASLQSHSSSPLSSPTLGLGVRYQLDVIHYIPWLGVTANSQLTPALSPITLGLELGLDRKLSERQAVSVALRLPRALHLQEGWAVGLSWRYDWLLFDPFDA